MLLAVQCYPHSLLPGHRCCHIGIDQLLQIIHPSAVLYLRLEGSLEKFCSGKFVNCYATLLITVPIAAMLIGLLQAHNTWITTISWALFAVDASNPLVLLVTESSDESVKIWQGCIEELIKSSETNHAPFSLLKEVITVDFVPVSALSVIVPVQSLHKMLLAVGKGSGSFEVWICDISASKFD